MNIRLTAGVATLAAVIAVTSTAFASLKGQQYAPQAKVSLARARAIALKAVPGGTIVDEELERERGGSCLRYSFDVRIKGKTHEVGIDAKTGTVLENSVEGAKAD